MVPLQHLTLERTRLGVTVWLSFLVLGIALDAINLRIIHRRRANGHGMSPFPLHSWFIYLFLCLLNRLPGVYQLVMLITLTIFHVTCYIGLPLWPIYAVSRWCRRTDVPRT